MPSVADPIAAAIHELLHPLFESAAQAVNVQGVVDILDHALQARRKFLRRFFPGLRPAGRKSRHICISQWSSPSPARKNFPCVKKYAEELIHRNKQLLLIDLGGRIIFFRAAAPPLRYGVVV